MVVASSSCHYALWSEWILSEWMQLVDTGGHNYWLELIVSKAYSVSGDTFDYTLCPCIYAFNHVRGKQLCTSRWKE